MKWIKGGVPLDVVFPPPKTARGKLLAAEADVAINLSLQINRARARARLTQGQLARRIGTTQTVISRIETANQNLTVETLVKIAYALKLEFVPILARKSQLPRIQRAVKEVRT
ncbi:MAG: helix-turn-helix transcriptional regulator [Elusimicrobia bacterium]|nr:helix-turn-helix transcriptional regulator [Elusimicrobiota bacterium]